MAEPLSYLYPRSKEDWLIIPGESSLLDQVEQRLSHLSAYPQPRRILLAEAEPLGFLAGFVAAADTQAILALGNPQWGKAEWQQAIALLQPDLIWGQPPFDLSGWPAPIQQESIPAGTILIPTGGSSGQLRFVCHTWQTLMASVKGFQSFFQVPAIHSCCVLPLYHVSGLMQFLRSLTTGGQFAIFPFRIFGTGAMTFFNPSDWFLSLVPTQLERLLQAGESDWLAQFHTILLGGAPAWPALYQQARQRRLPLAPTYGMTETAAQVATLHPSDFLQGKTGYRVSPHAHISITNHQGDLLPWGQTGQITLQAKSLMTGYYPAQPMAPLTAGFLTDDLGYFDSEGYLHLYGRASDKIISGGENIFPAEVEAALRATGGVEDVAVVGLEDDDWGQAVTAVYVPVSTVSLGALQHRLRDRLSRYKQPKHWVAVAALPRNSQGKLNRRELAAIARAALNQPTAATMPPVLETGAAAAGSPDEYTHDG